MSWKRCAWTVLVVAMVLSALTTLSGCFFRGHDRDHGGEHGER